MLYQATSGQTAMELAAAAEVDIIISDWEVAAKNLELTTKAALLARSNQFNTIVDGKLKQLETLLDDKFRALELLREIRSDIEKNTGQDNWQYVEMAFHNLHPTFCKNITKQFPNLTPGRHQAV